MKLDTKFDSLYTLTGLEDFLSASLDGNMWACVDNSAPEFHDAKYASDTIEGTMARILMDGKAVTILDQEETEGPWTLTLDALRHGVEVLCGKYPRMALHYIANGDYVGADSLLQCALMDDIVFG